MFLGSLCSTSLMVLIFLQSPWVVAQQSAPSMDLFDEKSKKPIKKVEVKSTKKSKPEVKRPVVKTGAPSSPTANLLAKPTGNSSAKSVVKAAEKKATVANKPSSISKPVSQNMPQAPAPVPIPPVAPPPPPSQAPSSVVAPAAPNSGRNVRRVVNKPRSEFEKRIGLGYATWREPLTYAVGNSTRGGKASFAGFLLRYEMSKKSSPINWGGSASFFYGAADAKSNDSSSYRVNKVGAQALIASPFAFFEPMAEVQVKIALDITYKILSWPSTVGAYDVRTKPLSYGPNVGIEYRLWNQWLVEQKIGSYSPEGDVYWSVGATYKLP